MLSLLLGKQKIANITYPTHYKTKYVVTGYATGEPGVGYITNRGHRVKHGTIAVDPRVIPFGSKIYVPGYGWGIADDTGGKIKGRHIDVYLPSRHLANRFGRKHLDIIVYPAKHLKPHKNHKKK